MVCVVIKHSGGEVKIEWRLTCYEQVRMEQLAEDNRMEQLAEDNTYQDGIEYGRIEMSQPQATATQSLAVCKMTACAMQHIRCCGVLGMITICYNVDFVTACMRPHTNSTIGTAH